MEVRLLSPREPVSFEQTRSGTPPGAAAAPAKTDAAPPLDTPKAKIAETEDETVFDRETVTELTERTAELLSIFDRELKYEVLEEAGVVQIQVIDARDGRVVRKVPADEVVRFVEAMKKKIDDRVDVRA
jgi:uncharacterized FlaG/YvyC family protein